MANETLSIQKANVLKAHSKGDAFQKGLLETLFGKEVFSQKITDRIKTFEDARDMVVPASELPNLSVLMDYPGINKDIISARAQAKLSIIARALNEGWTPDWKNSSQYKYFPWFKANPSGSGLSCNDYVCALANSCIGSRLCFKSAELAEYVGKQFEALYNDLFNL